MGYPCNNCSATVGQDYEIYTDVHDAGGSGSHDGCSTCAATCTDCGETFYRDGGLRITDDGHDMFCKKCWNDHFAW